MKYSIITSIFLALAISSCGDNRGFSGEWESTPVNTQHLNINVEDETLIWGFKTQIVDDTFNLRMENIREVGDTMQFVLNGITRGPLANLSLSVQLVKSENNLLNMYSKPIVNQKADEIDYLFDENDYTSFVKSR